MYRTTAESMSAAIARQQAAQCAAGRHDATCPHRRDVSPWVKAALARTLMAKELAR